MAEDRELTPGEVDLLSRHGVIRGRDGLTHMEPNPELAGVRGRGLFDDPGEYHRMVTYDGMVRGVDFVITMNIMHARRVFDPPGDPTAEELAIHSVLSRWSGLVDESSQQQSTGILHGGMARLYRHFALAHRYGSSTVEHDWQTHRIDGQLYTLPTRWRWIAPWSVNRWLYDAQDNIVALEQVVQRDPGGGRRNVGRSTDRSVDREQRFIIIPYNRCIHHMPLAIDGNQEGEPLYRAAWGWYRATMDSVKQDLRMQDRLIDGMTVFEELGGPSGVAAEVSDEDLDAMLDSYVTWLEGDIAALWVPYGVGINHTWPSQTSSFSEERLKYYDAQKLMSLGAMLFSLAGSHAASRSLEEGMARIMYKVIGQLAQQIDDTINGQPGVPGTGLFRRAASANFDIDTHRLGSVRSVGIEHQDINSMISSMSRAAQFLLYTPEAEDELLFREAAGLRRSSLDEIREARARVATKAGQMSQQGSQSGQGPQQSPESARAKANEGEEHE